MNDSTKNVEKNLFDLQQKKLQAVCAENELRYEFNYDECPVTLIVRPDTQVPGQMSLLGSENKKMSAASCIKFLFKDGAISYEIHNGFVISDAVFSKIKGLFKKMHYTLLQCVYRIVIEEMGEDITELLEDEK